MRFISWLLDLAFPPRDTEAHVRTLTPSALGALASPRVIDAQTTITALLPYRTRTVRALILESKFRGNERAHELLGGILADYLLEWYAETSSFERVIPVLVPVPLSTSREKERGYNQAERICQAALLTLPPAFTMESSLLIRSRDTLPQTSLGKRERLRNMEEAFGVTTTPQERHTYIVIDDVATTGATLAAAVASFHAAGTRTVVPLALAF